MLDTSGFARAGSAELDAIFREHGDDRRVVLALYDALRPRSSRQARKLFEEVRKRVLSFDGSAPAATPPNEAKPTSWFRPSVIFSVAGVVLAGIAQGVCHAVGFHLWNPIWNRLQQLIGLGVGS
jgi:hypothetical protein